MIFDFAQVDVTKAPLLVLQNLDGISVGVLKTAFNVELDGCFNEISTLTFTLPRCLPDGSENPFYDLVTGMRVVTINNLARFVLIDPEIQDDGVRCVKNCTAYSLEYEFTFKKFELMANTYNLWNPLHSEDTLLGIILSIMPSWTIGEVDASLIDKYRTFDDSGDQNLYNFIKSDIQKAYGCVFDFDTYNRKIYVRDVVNEPKTKPIFVSMKNLVKDISIKEDTESIVTSLAVSGAEGVDIRSVNPTGSKNIINLDYFADNGYFSDEIKEKYLNWKSACDAERETYFAKTVEEALKVSQVATFETKIVTMEGELSALENVQAVIVQGIAQGVKTQSDLDTVNANIAKKKSDIKVEKRSLQSLKDSVEQTRADLSAINARTRLTAFFTGEEYRILDRYLKEDSLQENSFVTVDTDAFAEKGTLYRAQGATFHISDIKEIKQVKKADGFIDTLSGGRIVLTIDGLSLDAAVIRASSDRSTDGSILFTARLGVGMLNQDAFYNASISISGKWKSFMDKDHSLDVEVGTADIYFTRSVTEYERKAVEWDLYEYGEKMMRKLAAPSFEFSIDLANFLALKEFVPFKMAFTLGSRLYLQLNDGRVLTPYVISVHIPFDNPPDFSLELSSKYYANDESFAYTEIIEEAHTAGKTLSGGKWEYGKYTTSGAEARLNKFMKESLDVARKSIISSEGQDITWGTSGMRFRKRDSSGSVNPFEIWINNGQIMFTRDNWGTANLAIGQIKTEAGSVASGVIADQLIGKLVAGSSLVIESAKQDGGSSVFRVDGTGARLHNASISAQNDVGLRVVMDPYAGLVIGKSPLYTNEEAHQIDPEKALFWADKNGSLHLKGSLDGCDGRFKGIVQASEFQDLNGRNILTPDYKIAPNYLELKGLNVADRFIISETGEITVKGNITMMGGNIVWSQVNEKDSSAYKKAESAAGTANGASQKADSAAAKADSASSKANGASTKADSALTQANNAVTKATSASTKADSALTKASDANTKANDAMTEAKKDKVTPDKVFETLTQGGTKFGVFSDSGTGELYINANYIRSGMLNADKIILGSQWGGFRCANGLGDSGVSYGAMMYGGDKNFYFIATDQGVRMQSSKHGLTITDNGLTADEEIGIGSDRRIKNSISYDMSKYQDFFMKLKPSAFKLNNGSSGRLHIGFIAQDVETALAESGVSSNDFAGLVKTTEGDTVYKELADQMYLRYTDFIALNTYMTQTLCERVRKLEERVGTV